MDVLLPVFEESYGVNVKLLAVGTGQALAMGSRGDVDVVLVHNQELERAFIEDGYGIERHPLMVNDFVLIGPHDDPADVRGEQLAADALRKIATAQASFASRGDDSGTHARELKLWVHAGLNPNGDDVWYLSLGQGMGETLQFAQEHAAYTLSDRGTYLVLQAQLPDLDIMVGARMTEEDSDPSLRNPYALIAVNHDNDLAQNIALANRFISWMTGSEAQRIIGAFSVDGLGYPLFYPDSELWRSSSGAN
jgi:tungstate transport system substrate-binding protein